MSTEEDKKLIKLVNNLRQLIRLNGLYTYDQLVQFATIEVPDNNPLICEAIACTVCDDIHLDTYYMYKSSKPIRFFFYNPETNPLPIRT